MKRAYSKPTLAVESFQLDAAVAAGCSDANHIALGHAVETCTYDDQSGIDYAWDVFGNACGINKYEQDACYQAMAFTQGFLDS